MQNITLNNGVKIPVLGFGVFQIPPAETNQAVIATIVNHDTVDNLIRISAWKMGV